MTIFDIIIATSASAAAICGSWRALNWWIARRASANEALSAASRDFYHALNSMLKTPGDIPDDVLASLGFMSRILNSRDGAQRLVTALKHLPPAQGGAPATLEMRPELQKLYSEASVAWLLAMVHRNVFLSVPIYRELVRIQSARHEAGVTPAVARSAARTMATGYPGELCAA